MINPPQNQAEIDGSRNTTGNNRRLVPMHQNNGQTNCHSTRIDIREMTFKQMADFFTNQGAATQTEGQVAKIEELKDDESQ